MKNLGFGMMRLPVLSGPTDFDYEHVNLFGGLDKQSVIASDGTDLTELVEKAVAWLTENSF